MTDANKNAYRTAWVRENTKRILVRINVNKEKDVVEWIEKIPNKQGYIISLIKADMKKNK